MGQRYREKEGREEMQAAVEVGSTSINGILRFNGLSIVYTSYEQKRNRHGEIVQTTVVNVRGQDVGATGKTSLWQKFLDFKGYVDKSLISLVKNTALLTEEYYS